MNSLMELASILRSKNAGPLYITFDIIFNDKEVYERVINSGIITKALISQLYNVSESEVLIIKYDIVNSIKITIPRKYVSGDIHDNDIYGCQQHVPLAKVLIP